MKDYRNIHAWQKAHQFVLQVYKATQTFPAKEVYGLTSQLRRAAVSIPANVAEGYGRSTDSEIARFIDISLGSVNEVEYLLYLSTDLKYCTKQICDELSQELIEIRKMLVAFAKTLRAASKKAGSR